MPSSLASSTSPQESAQIRELVDKDADQQLDFEEFRQLVKIKEKNRKYTEEQLHEYFDSLDLDGSGTVDLNEYDKYRLQDAMAARERAALVDANMQSITDVGDGDDKIDFDEFVALVRLCEKNYEGTDDDLRERFDEMDADMSGQLEMEEFENFRISVKHG